MENLKQQQQQIQWQVHNTKRYSEIIASVLSKLSRLYCISRYTCQWYIHEKRKEYIATKRRFLSRFSTSWWGGKWKGQNCLLSM